MLFHFVERKWWYFLFSALLIVPGVFFLAIGGLRPGIEFKGGTLLEIQFATRPEDSLVKTIALASLLIVLLIAWAFRNFGWAAFRYGIAAIVALLHDAGGARHLRDP